MSEDTDRSQFRRLSLKEVRAILGPVDRMTAEKIDDELCWTARRFIAHSPFVCLATQNETGADASPRGDGPGFVKVLDSKTLTIPDRSGNALADSFRNILLNSQIGMLFFVPGMRETLRVNGTAYITDDLKVRTQHLEDGKLPKLALIVTVKEVFFHCGKALIRSRLWDPSAHVNPADVSLASNVFSLRYVEHGHVAMTSADFTSTMEIAYVADL